MLPLKKREKRDSTHHTRRAASERARPFCIARRRAAGRIPYPLPHTKPERRRPSARRGLHTTIGGHMVTRRQMELIAWSYDTVMSRAMLAALGVLEDPRQPLPGRRRRRARKARRGYEPTRDEVLDCMRQTHGVDGL